jgi:hypothetical protein
MATYDYQSLLNQTYPNCVRHREYTKTIYEQTLSDFPNQLDLTQPIPDAGLVVLAESRSTAGIPLETQPANEYRFAINNFAIEICATTNTISIFNPQFGDKNSINNISTYNHIEFQKKIIDYENMHFDVYTKGQFRLSNELSTLLIKLINNITNGKKYQNINYSNAGLNTQITQEPANSVKTLVFDGWVYTRSHVAYKYNNSYPVCELKTKK